MIKKLCLLGILSWCDFEKYPLRFKAFKSSIASIKKYIPKDLCVAAVVDNNSSKIVKDFIKKSDIFDIKILLPENIHDIGVHALLAKICRDNHLPYFFPIDNDHIFFRKNFLKPCIEMLENYPDCGHMRLIKFSYKDRHKYDKSKFILKGHDNANQVWLYNIETREDLEWSKPIKKANFIFYINNWHWGTCGPLVKLSVWDKIFPKMRDRMPIYHNAEREMRTNYQKLGLKTLVLDKGAFYQGDESVYKSSYNIFSGNFPHKIFKTLSFASRKTFIEAKKIKFYLNNYKKFQIK